MELPDWIESARYGLALAIWVSLPAAVVYWLLIHPLARFWRRVGLFGTFAAAIAAMAVTGFIAWQFRFPALEIREPMRLPLVVGGALLYAFAAVIEVKCRRYLKLRTLVGVPEISEGDRGELLTEGIYAHSRNPRYLDVMIGLVGWAMILNIHGLYWMVLATNVGIYGIALLEERELADRFGAEYEAYRRRVPRLLPRSLAFLRD